MLDLLRAGQRPMLAIAARLGHFRDPGAVDRALRRSGTLIGLDELLESVLGATPAGPTSPRLGGPVVARPSIRAGGWPGRSGRPWASRTDRWRASPRLLEERFPLDVDFSPLPEAVDGLCASIGGRSLILVGHGKPSSRQRFTLAHTWWTTAIPSTSTSAGCALTAWPRCAPTPSRPTS